MLGISATHWLITNSVPEQWDNQIHFLINTKCVLQGHHCAGPYRGLSCVFLLPPLMAMSKLLKLFRSGGFRRGFRAIMLQHGQPLGCILPAEAASKDNVCRQSVSKRSSHAPNGHQLLPFTLCPEAWQTRLGFGLLSQSNAS